MQIADTHRYSYLNCLSTTVPASLLALGVTTTGPQWNDCSLDVIANHDCQLVLQAFPWHFYPTQDCCRKPDKVECDENGHIISITAYSQGDPPPETVGFNWSYDLNPAFGRGLQYLKSLSLSNPPLDRMLGLEELVNLEMIYMDNSIGGIVPGEIFQSLTKLRSVIISGVCVELGDFGPLNSLQDLLLYNTACRSAPYPTLSDTIGDLVALENLQFNQQGLVGTIPDSIGSLTNLRYLDLGENYLQGPIPSSIQSLQKLQKLILYTNSLRGQIPSWLGDLTLLEQLQLDGNLFNGSIPSSLGKLTNLNTLRLNSNYLQGHIPPEIGLLPNVTVLNIEANGLTGTVPLPMAHLQQLFTEQPQLTPNECEARKYQPYDCLALLESFPSLPITKNCCYYWDMVTCNSDWQITGLTLTNASLSGPIPSPLKKLEKLSDINFSDNSLNGTIPSWLSELRLTSLTLRHNSLTGSLPESYDNWRDLTDLDVSGNSLSGPIPSGLWTLTQLGNLDLSYNDFTGEISADLGNLQQLFYITLSWNHFNGTVPESLWTISSLANIDLSNNKFSGSLPPVIANFDQLEIFDISFDEFTGQLPKLANLSSLWSFKAAHNLFVGDIPPELGTDFENINHIDLSHNMLTGIPQEIVKSPYIEELDISYNLFTGPFPSGFGSTSGLRTLKVGSNAFTGPFPQFLENIISLQSLYLDNTLMEGSIPESWRLLTSLTTLHLKNNSISGSIPNFLGTFSSLENLDLSNNKLSGLIPSSLGNLTSLTVLDLHDNPFTNISGTLPDSLQNLQSVSTIGLWDNWISGELPLSLGNLSSLNYFWVNDNLLNGTVPESFERLSKLKDINLSDNCMTGTLTQKLLDKGFTLDRQREVCSKYSLPANKTVSSSTVRSSTHTTPINFPTDSKVITHPIPINEQTVVETYTSTSFPSPSNTLTLHSNNNTFNGNQSSSNKSVVIGATSGAISISPPANSPETKNRDPQLPDDYRPHFYLSNSMPSVSKSTTQLTPGTIAIGSHRPIKPLSITITHTNLPPDPAHGEVDPAIVAHFQRLAEEQPINAIELEQGLQRLHGPFSSWSHELVNEWVGLRSFDAVVVRFITDFYIDGAILNNLSMNVLQEKYEIQEFRHRAMIMQAVEFLRHSSMTPGVTDIPLPLYED
ncbi:hypothetical protein HDU76_005262 [Blyttiomyces sp. JEL0837]|nr:hypothetical protein HDU76_005262 [Blyttiomyces sp. JEL0837]